MIQTPWQFVVLVLAACLMLPLALVIWRNWDMPIARPLAGALVLCSGWCIIAAFEVSTAVLPEKILLFKLRMTFLPFIPALLLESYYRYAKGTKLLVGWKLFAILIIPVTSAILAWLPGQLFCYDFRLGHTGTFTTLIFSRGPANIIYFSYCTAIAIFAVLLMTATWAHSPPWMRRGSLLFIVIYILPASTDFLFVTGWSPTPGFNYTPLVFALSASILIWILFGERIFNLGPAARSVLMEHLKELLFVIDHTNHVIDANSAAAKMLGTTPEKLFGQPVETALGNWPDVLALLDSGMIENHAVHLPSSTEAWECSVFPIPNQRKPQAHLILLRNVTERTRIEEELRSAKESAESSNEAKSAFLAMMSHEIRTPMGGVVGFAQLLDQTPLSPEQKDYVQMIRSSGEAQLRIINDILDYSKVEAGRMELEEQPFLLPAEIEKNCLLLLPQAQKKGISLQWKIASGIPTLVEGDSLRLGQILINLIGNAIKFTASGAVSVTVDAQPVSQHESLVRFMIADTGIGIAPEAMSRLFQSFSQVESSTARRYGGTGLGLAIAMRLCNLMGGDLTAQSREGQGSTFVASIRLRLANRPGPRELSGPIPSHQTDQPLRILVVEDNSTNQRLAQVMLQKMGHKVTVCSDGKSSIDILKQQDFDVVFMDIEMPGMDGFETVAEIRKLEKTGELPRHNRIIALTAHAIAGNRERCLAAGMDDYTTKPLTFDALKATLTRDTAPEPL